MSIVLHKDCQEQLKAQLEKHLRSLIVTNGKYLDFSSTFPLRSLDSIVPRGQAKELRNYISDTPLYDFVYGSLAQELEDTQTFEWEMPPRALTEIDGYQDPSVTAQKLITKLTSLPWDYSIAFKINNRFGNLYAQGRADSSLCDRMNLLVPNDNTITEFPIKSAVEARNAELTPSGFISLARRETLDSIEWDQSCTYLQIKMNGFIGGGYTERAPLFEAVSLLKGFCGMGMALNLFKPGLVSPLQPIRRRALIHRRINDAWSVERVFELDSSISETIDSLQLDDRVESLGANARPLITTLLNSMRCVFGRPNAERLVLACQWFFDSHSGRNHLLSFVQTMVAMEILLGDRVVSDEMGLTGLLSNRCAYLIAETCEERDKILQEFQAIYDLRCGIVHRGKIRFTEDEQELVFKLDWICRRVIQKEIQLRLQTGTTERESGEVHLVKQDLKCKPGVE